MAKIVLNKNFNIKYLSRYAQRMIDNQNNINYSNMFLCNESILNILDKIDNHYIITEETENNITKLDYVLNNLLSKNNINRENVLNELVSAEIITQDEADTFILTFRSFTNDKFIKLMNDDIITMSISTPSTLSSRFVNADNNPNDEQLYLCIIPYNNSNLTTKNGFVNTFQKLNGDIIQQTFSYMAFSIGLKDSGKDLEYDFLEKIDMFDEINIKIALPKEIS